MKKHSKHSNIPKPRLGKYARNEWAILGAPCGMIQSFVEDLAKELNTTYKLAYIDASHNAEHIEAKPSLFQLQLEERGNTQNLLLSSQPSIYGFKHLLNQTDIAFVNGNHFKATQQIVILHPKKLASLERKLDRLTNVSVIIKNGVEEVPSFLQEHVQTATILEWDQSNKLLEYIQENIQRPLLNALILTGGKSTRMGEDKAQINYHGMSQLDYMIKLVNPHCEQSFISVRADQQEQYAAHECIADTFIGLGPFGGILSAFQKNPDSAFLVAAVDMPNINEAAIQELMEGRNPAKVATAFLNPATDFPDPLFTIYEPKAYPKLLQYLSLGYACPRKMLINEEIELITSQQENLLLNINTPTEKANYRD